MISKLISRVKCEVKHKMAEANPQSEINSEAKIKEYVRISKEKLERDAERANCEINTKLDNLIETINAEREENLNRIDRELNKGIDQLEKYETKSLARLSTKERMAKDLKEDAELLSKLNHEFDEELNKTPELPSFKMQWNPNLIRVCEDVVKMGNLKIFYQSRFEDSKPIWSKLNKENEVGEPKAVAIDPETSNIYVGDASSGKIFVLNKFGEYLDTIKFKKPSSIGNMTICQNYIYCKSNGFWANTLYRINKHTGELLNKYKLFIPIDAFTLSDQVFLCNFSVLDILKLDLTESKEINLESPYIKNNSTHVRNIKCINDELITLLADAQDYPIQVFDKKGNFLRGILGDVPVLRGIIAVYMCIDDQRNIILSIKGQVNVYSKVGKFITSVGTKGDDSEGMYRPRGIALDKVGNLLVCNNRNRNILQAY